MPIESIIRPLRPLNQAPGQWIQYDVSRLAVARAGYPVEAWVHSHHDIRILSAVEVAREADGSSNGPEYHLSVSGSSWFNGSHVPARVDTNQARWVLAEFGLDGAEEDNHVPHGVVRNFWRPVAQTLIGKECPCKAEEVVIREMKGDFIWRP